MNKVFTIFLLFLAIFFFQSCRNCNKDIALDSSVLDYFSKSGSYFIYSDSSDHIIDSEYVYRYTYNVGVTQVGEPMDGCYTSGDLVKMYQLSFQNTVFYDSLNTAAGIASYYGIIDTKGYYHYTQSVNFIEPSYNTPSFNNFFVGGNVFPIVYEEASAYYLIENGDSVPMDLYFAPNYGIVKRVEHRPTGDVSWDLIRSHIVH